MPGKNDALSEAKTKIDNVYEALLKGLKLLNSPLGKQPPEPTPKSRQQGITCERIDEKLQSFLKLSNKYQPKWYFQQQEVYDTAGEIHKAVKEYHAFFISKEIPVTDFGPPEEPVITLLDLLKWCLLLGEQNGYPRDSFLGPDNLVITRFWPPDVYEAIIKERIVCKLYKQRISIKKSLIESQPGPGGGKATETPQKKGERSDTQSPQSPLLRLSTWGSVASILGLMVGIVALWFSFPEDVKNFIKDFFPHKDTLFLICIVIFQILGFLASVATLIMFVYWLRTK